MNTGIELIIKERKEQIEKHGYTFQSDYEMNLKGQLTKAASYLLKEDIKQHFVVPTDALPDGWDLKRFEKMCNKGYKERLIIAGALIAAEIDLYQGVKDIYTCDDGKYI